MHFPNDAFPYICLDKEKHRQFLSIKKMLHKWTRNKLTDSEWNSLAQYTNTILKELQNMDIENLSKATITKNTFGELYDIKEQYSDYLDSLQMFNQFVTERKTIRYENLSWIGNQLLFRHSAIYYQSYWFLEPIPSLNFSTSFTKFLKRKTSDFFRWRYSYFEIDFEDFFQGEFDTDAFFLIPARFSEDVLYELEEATVENADELALFRQINQQNLEEKIYLILYIPD